MIPNVLAPPMRSYPVHRCFSGLSLCDFIPMQSYSVGKSNNVSSCGGKCSLGRSAICAPCTLKLSGRLLGSSPPSTGDLPTLTVMRRECSAARWRRFWRGRLRRRCCRCAHRVRTARQQAGRGNSGLLRNPLVLDIHRRLSIALKPPRQVTPARKCKGCPGTICKGCHGTVHTKE
jgi:hypothetical protein